MVKYYIISYYYLTSHLFTIKTEVFSWNLCSAPSQAFFWLIGRLDINVTFWTVFVINKESCNLAISNYYLGHTVEINIVCVCGYCIKLVTGKAGVFWKQLKYCQDSENQRVVHLLFSSIVKLKQSRAPPQGVHSHNHTTLRPLCVLIGRL